jgi:ribosomal RNA-processing protein 9
VGQLTEDSFVTGGQDGGICLWKEAAKKPVCSVTAAHGLDGFSPRWITSLATFKMTDTVISGSYDGFVKIWQGNTATQSLQPTSQIAVEGFVNSLAVSSKLLVVGTGSEHRLGRWWKLKGNHNVVQLFKLPA